MTKNEEIISAAEANLRLEGMRVTSREKKVAMDCLTGKRSFDEAVADVIRRHKKRGA